MTGGRQVLIGKPVTVLGNTGAECGDGGNHQRRVAEKTIRSRQSWIRRWTVEDRRTQLDGGHRRSSGSENHTLPSQSCRFGMEQETTYLNMRYLLLPRWDAPLSGGCHS